MENRRCLICDKQIFTNYAKQITCGEKECRREYMRIYHTIYPRTGKSNEGKPLLTHSNELKAWKESMIVYRDFINENKNCFKCGCVKKLLTHHIDGNRYNNRLNNLQRLCKRCHQLEHDCSNVLPKGKELGELKKKQASKAKRDQFGRFIK